MRGGYRRSNIDGAELGIVRVAGQISGTGVEHIRAHRSRFFISDADDAGWIVDEGGLDLDGVHALVENG